MKLHPLNPSGLRVQPASASNARTPDDELAVSERPTPGVLTPCAGSTTWVIGTGTDPEMTPSSARRAATEMSAHLLTEIGQPWQYVTILFSDLCSSVALAETLESTVYVKLIQRFRRDARRVVALCNGTIARLQGDGILVFFRGELGPEDDARRALACALALHAAVRADTASADGSPAPTLALHSGIHAGLTFIDDGDIERGRYDLIGSTPNIAARLASLARRDQILASDLVLLSHRDSFLTRGVRLIRLRGCALPVPTYRVVGVRHDAVTVSHVRSADVARNGAAQSLQW